MDRRSWPWKQKPSEKSPGETESSGSASPYSERYSDDQEVSRASPNNTSPNHYQSPELSSNITGSEVQETVNKLTEKLSAALLNINAKEDLVKQHTKVAEEAISGWEKTEAELVDLKQQLEVAAQKNSALEERIGHLDEALKESVRQLRKSREEKEQKVHDLLMKKTHEWESDKFELENRIAELQVQLEAAKSETTTHEWESDKFELENRIAELQVQLEAEKAETTASADHDLQSKLETAEKESMTLKVELLARTEDLQKQTWEKELSTRAAESASKQHLDSIKKVAKLEAECRRLQAVARKTSLAHDYKPIVNSVCVESLTDSQSDSGERFLGMDNDPSCSDSWASALIAELDQFKIEKVSTRNIATCSVEIDLMDDFLEMERLVAIPEANHGSSSFELESKSNRLLMSDSPLKVELDVVHCKMAELEEKIAKMESEKAELEMVLANCQNQLEFSRNQVLVAEDKLVVLQRHLDSANESKLVTMTEIVVVEEKGKVLESQLELANLEVRKLHEKVCTSQGQVEKEKTVSAEFAAKLEALETSRKAMEYQVESSNFEVKKLREKVDSLEVQVEEEKAVSLEFAAKVETLVAERRELECLLELATLKVKKLNDKVDALEGKAEEEKTISAELAAKVEASESKRKEIECQLESAHLEIGKLHEQATLLEGQIEEERSLSREFAVKLETSEAAKMESDTQLKLAHLEVGVLHDKVGLLQAKIEEEKALSAQLAGNHRSFEGVLSRKKHEADIQRITSSNGGLKIKQEKEMAVAAGKLAECQKTIASLSNQLKSLTSLDDFMLEIDRTELNGRSPDISIKDLKKLHSTDYTDSTCSSAFPSGKERGSPLSSSSPSTTLSGFSRLVSLGRRSYHTKK